MFFQRGDKVFEDAARNPERFDRLFNQYRRVRTGMFASFVVTFAALLAFAVWFLMQAFRFLGAINGGRQYSMPPSFEHILSDKGLVGTIGFVAFVWAMSSLSAALAADSRIKSLILFRALRDHRPPMTPE